MNALSQKGVRIGYIDTDYILENIPEFQEINQQLNSNVVDWKKEIESREKEIKNKRDILNKERILLTTELIDEREEDLDLEEEEIYKYKQDRFGPNGDFILQKKQLIQPIQDQIFLAIQEIAKTRKYDFIFDKSADIVMLYSDKRYDISEQILRTILRSNNRNQVDSRIDKKKLQNESVVSKSNIVENEKAEGNEKSKIEDKKDTQETEDIKLTKKEVEDKIKKIMEERKKSLNRIDEDETINSSNYNDGLLLEKKLKTENSSLTLEERRRILEEKKKKILESRKAKLDAKKTSKDSTFTNN